MTTQIQDKMLSTGLIVVNFLLLLFLLNYGYVTEDRSMLNIYIMIAYCFGSSLIFTIYYRQNYKTLAFWIMVVSTLLFLMATALYLYFLALSKADWR